MTTPNERAERERIRKPAARQGFKMSCKGPNDENRFMLSNDNSCMTFGDLREVAEKLRVRAL